MDFGGLEYVILEFGYLPIFVPILTIIISLCSFIRNVIKGNLVKSTIFLDIILSK